MDTSVAQYIRLLTW